MKCMICNGPLPKKARYNQKCCSKECQRERDIRYMKGYNPVYWSRKKEQTQVKEMRTDTTNLQSFLCGAK